MLNHIKKLVVVQTVFDLVINYQLVNIVDLKSVIFYKMLPLSSHNFLQETSLKKLIILIKMKVSCAIILVSAASNGKT